MPLRTFRPRLRQVGSVGSIVTLLLLTLASVNPGAFASALATDQTTSAASLDCNSVWDPAPSSLYIPLPDPSVPLAPGGELALSLEFGVVNYTESDLGIELELPTVDFTFTLPANQTYTSSLSPRETNIDGAGWQSPAALNQSASPSGGLEFTSGGEARVSTQKIAVQAEATYGTLTLEFRWMWSLREPNGTELNSSWTVPEQSYGGGSELPSIFFPAQYIEFLKGPGGGEKVTIGTTYSATLGGPVAGRYFFLEMENGAGHVVQSHATTLPEGVSEGNVTISVLNYDNYLPPGEYLVHIHDVCGAILYNKLIDAVFAPSVRVTFFLQPGLCGPMTFNGTPYANDTSGTYVPSTLPYNFTNPRCPGYSFSGWSSTGGLHVSANDRLMVSYNGTFTIVYKAD